MCEIDLDGLELHLKEIIEDGRGDSCYTKAKNVLRLVSLVREAEADAKRYRWLRDKAHTVTGLTPCAFVMNDGDLMEDWNGQYGLLCLGALDAAVDDAMARNSELHD